MIGASPEVAATVERLEAALAGTVSQLGDAKAEINSLEAELVAARSLADDWRDIAIQLAATCRDLRNDLQAAHWGGHHQNNHHER